MTPPAQLRQEIDQYLEGEEAIDAPRPRPKSPGSLTKAILEKAVMATQLYLGCLGGRTRPRDEQKLQDRMHRAIQRVVEKSAGLIEYGNAYRQIHDEAKRRGRIMPIPGMHI